MANYYYVTIKSDKVTQEVANEIFNVISEKNRVRSFDFIEAGVVSYNTRGLTDITEILNKYGFTDEEIEVKDEFTRAYEAESKTIYEVISEEIDRHKAFMEKYSKLIELPEETKEAMEVIALEQDKIKNVIKNVKVEIPTIPKLNNPVLKGFEL